jgi:hypothetical protein
MENKEILKLDKQYYEKIEEFENLYKINKEKILTSSKTEFRYLCYRYINSVKDVKLPKISQNKINESVLIEFRSFPHLEFIIRNNIIKLGSNWSHTVVCGNLNYDFMVTLCNNISPNIKIIKLDYDNMQVSEYSKLLASVNFWDLFTGEKILIYQEDSIIFRSNIEQFIDWDYIGAPWPQNINQNNVGNGGLSLRTKKCMIDIINKISIGSLPEDIYFVSNMLKFGIGKLADWNSAFNFSSELVFNPNSFGMHNLWLSCSSWRCHIYNKLIQNKCLITYNNNLNNDNLKINLMNLIKFFILNKNCIIYLCTDENNDIVTKIINKYLGDKYLKFINHNIFSKYLDYKKEVTYHINIKDKELLDIKICSYEHKNYKNISELNDKPINYKNIYSLII